MKANGKPPTAIPVRVKPDSGLPPHPPQHCTHVAGAPFPVGATGTIIGVPQSCCWCGPTPVLYIGVVEPGHGPFITYQPGAAKSLLIPNGAAVGRG